MPQIHFRRFRPTNDDGWELDCFVIHDDLVRGEMVDFKHKTIRPFKRKGLSGLYASFDEILNRLSVDSNNSRTEARLVVGRTVGGSESHYFLRAPGAYPSASPEAEIWKIVDAIYEEEMNL